MKKVALLLLALSATGLASVQAQTHPASHASQSTHEEYMVMEKGKMMMVHGGKTMPMTEIMTMSDGTLCMTDGTCKRKDGTVVKLKEGDHCMIENGQMVVHSGGKKSGKKGKSKMKGMKGMSDE
jgi:hypothetical protein